MRKDRIKMALAVVMLITLMAPAFRPRAYQPYVQKAAKFGAKDCLFCHTNKDGGEGWNERGQWLIEEKDRRRADAIDVEWLVDYKEKDKEKEKVKDPA